MRRAYTARVFDETVNNQALYNDLARPIVDRALMGCNGTARVRGGVLCRFKISCLRPATIFAYGQTASGKTHTIQVRAVQRRCGCRPRSSVARAMCRATGRKRVWLRAPSSTCFATSPNRWVAVRCPLPQCLLCHRCQDEGHRAHRRHVVQQERVFLLRASFMEIYLEETSDLLADAAASACLLV